MTWYSRSTIGVSLAATGVVVVGWLLEASAVIAAVAAGLPAWAAVAAGVAAAIGVAWVGVIAIPALRRRTARGHAGRRVSVMAGLVVATLAASALYLLPTVPASSAPEGIELRDGSVMPVRVHERPGGLAPVVAVHGGPGIPFTQLEERNILDALPDRTVVFYDQIGAGGATRLDRPSEYSTARAVSDLSELLDHLDFSHAVLLGFSAGASVVTSFAAEHPEGVDALLLLAPGSLPVAGREAPPAQPQSRLSLAEAVPLYVTAMAPRNLFMYLLTLANPDAAHELGGDAEMDARFAELEQLSAGGLTCSGEPAQPPASPPGHYLHEQLQRESGTGLTGEDLKRLQHVPVLLLRGVCDYIPRSEAEYTATQLPQAQLVDVAGAGHALLEEQPAVVHAEIERFLAEHPAM